MSVNVMKLNNLGLIVLAVIPPLWHRHCGGKNEISSCEREKKMDNDIPI